VATRPDSGREAQVADPRRRDGLRPTDRGPIGKEVGSSLGLDLTADRAPDDRAREPRMRLR